MSEYIIKLPNGGAADECIRLRGYEKSLYGYELHEEIVRCKDCKFCDYDIFAYWCCRGVGHQEFEVDSLDGECIGFCAWGERRGA